MEGEGGNYISINTQYNPNNNIINIPNYNNYNNNSNYNYQYNIPYNSNNSNNPNSQIPQTPGQKISQTAKSLISSIISKTPFKKDPQYILDQADYETITELIKYDKSDYINKTEKIATIENYKEEEDGHISYLIKSKLIPSDLIRRYSDFFALHERLVANWPGIPIPNIPPKVLINNKEKSVIDLRKKLLEKFINYILNSIHLFKSKEVEIFLRTDIVSFKNTIKNINKLSYQEISDNYLTYFNRSDINEYKRAIINKEIYFRIVETMNIWIKLVQSSIKSIEVFKDEYEHKLRNTNNLLITLADYEKETLSTYAKNNYSKMIFTNKANKLFLTTLINYKNENKNPYSDFYDFLEEKELELFSWKTALDAYMEINTKFFEIKEKVNELNNKAQYATLGKISLLESALFRKPPEVKDNALREMEELNVQLNQVGTILHILSNKYYTDINYFLNQIYHMFYNCVMNSVFIFKKNDMYTMNIWKDLIVKAKRVKKI